MSVGHLQSILCSLPHELSTSIQNSIVKGNELSIQVKLEHLRAMIEHIHLQYGTYLVTWHAVDERSIGGTFRLYCILEEANEDTFITISAALEKDDLSFGSLTRTIPAASRYEREMHDMFGLEPIGHPDPRPLVLWDDWPSNIFPLRKDVPENIQVPREPNPYLFTKVEGEGVFEIPVGPVHAGVIEPGHFRFSVAGEPIINLEARLGYVHKGIEKISEGMTYQEGVHLSERISGDNGVAHSAAYCQVIEKLGSAAIPERAEYIRVIYLEMERLYNHFGDIGGIALDTAFSVGASLGFMLREEVLDINEHIAGSRLLRSVNVVGGVRKDICPSEKELLLSSMVRLRLELNDLVELMSTSPSLQDRIETAGILTKEKALGLGVVGPAARASGVDRDARRDLPYAAYRSLNFIVPHYNGGDVSSRLHVKIDEAYESIGLVEQALSDMPSGDISVPVTDILPGNIAISVVESPRGELVHWVMSGKGKPYRHKIRDASFCNWPAIEHAVLGNVVPDFPLINKSFNLSYSGNDL